MGAERGADFLQKLHRKRLKELHPGWISDETMLLSLQQDRGGLQDGTVFLASEDPLQRFPIVGVLDLVQNLKQKKPHINHNVCL